jgi:hypothetical protein
MSFYGPRAQGSTGLIAVARKIRFVPVPSRFPVLSSSFGLASCAFTVDRILWNSYGSSAWP